MRIWNGERETGDYSPVMLTWGAEWGIKEYVEPTVLTAPTLVKALATALWFAASDAADPGAKEALEEAAAALDGYIIANNGAPNLQKVR